MLKEIILKLTSPAKQKGSCAFLPQIRQKLQVVRRWVGGGHESRVARNEFAEVAEYMVRYENETSTY